MTRVLQYKRGSILVFTTGEYSSYGLAGFLVAVRDLDLPKLAQEYAAACLKDEKTKYLGYVDTDEFASWLIANGHAMPVDVEVVHLGTWMEFEKEFGVERA